MKASSARLRAQVTSTSSNWLEVRRHQNDTPIGAAHVDPKIKMTTLRKSPEVCQTCARTGPTAATRGMTPAGGMYASTKKRVLLDREVLHRPIGRARLRGAGGERRLFQKLLPRRLLDTLNCETFCDCNHWSWVQLGITAVVA